MRSQQIRSRALQAIAEDQRPKRSPRAGSSAKDLRRRRENAILGTLAVIDPQTGIQYKVSSYGDYHCMSNEGYIDSTNSPSFTPSQFA